MSKLHTKRVLELATIVFRSHRRGREGPVRDRGILLLSLSANLAMLAGTPADLSAQQIVNVPIVVAPGDQINPDITAYRPKLIVWQDSRAGDWDIFYYNLDTRTEHRVTDDTRDQLHPAIMHGEIVWEEERNTDWDIFYFNAGTGVTTRIAIPGSDQRMPDVAHGIIFWQDNRVGNWDIYEYELATAIESPRAQGPSTQRKLDISHPTLVWEDNRNGNWDIYAWDRNAGRKVQITADPHDQRFPEAGPLNSIVWQDNRNGNWDIYARTGPVCTNPAAQMRPAVSEIIVWEDDRNGNWDIYAWDGVKEIQVTTDPADQRHPDVSRKKVVWQDRRGGDWDIWMADLDGVAETLFSESEP